MWPALKCDLYTKETPGDKLRVFLKVVIKWGQLAGLP